MPSDYPYSDESDEDSDDMEGYDLRDVSSDVEINPDELDMLDDDDGGRFQEVDDDEPATKPESKKRPRESDAMEAEGGEEKLSKS